MPKWVQDGYSPFSHCMRRNPRLRGDALIQNASMSLCRRSAAGWSALPWACAHTRAYSLNSACGLQILVLQRLRRGRACITVCLPHVHSKAGCQGWGAILNTPLITLRGFLMPSALLCPGRYEILCPLLTFSAETGHGSLNALVQKLTFPDSPSPLRVSFHLTSPTAENQCENSELDNSKN